MRDDGLFRRVVSGLLALLTSLLGVIAGLVCWIFLGVTRRVRELELEVAELKTRQKLLEAVDSARHHG